MAAAVDVFPSEGITPVELWDVLVDGRTLFARRDEPAFFAALARAAVALGRGEARRASGHLHPPRPWDDVATVGGAVDVRRARDAFRAQGVELGHVSSEADATVSRAWEALGEDCVVVDVGQSSTKAVGPGGRVRHARSAGLVEGVADALRAVAGRASPSRVVLALPCEIARSSGRISLGASTLPTEGDGERLAREIVAAAFEAPFPHVSLVNDAVLAAWALSSTLARSRSLSRPLACSRRWLVLTVGFGVGGALVASSAGPPCS